ncbi:MAG: hypothetical protein GY802_20430 [Gammaproteobacteria bacterium]|nr:hypothetical protein [Gammaproteobacteria bacterium]
MRKPALKNTGLVIGQTSFSGSYSSWWLLANSTEPHSLKRSRRCKITISRASAKSTNSGSFNSRQAQQKALCEAPMITIGSLPSGNPSRLVRDRNRALPSQRSRQACSSSSAVSSPPQQNSN